MSDVDFGYRKVSASRKTELVGDVFHSVARRYDVMNDLMSLGLHRVFKRMTLQMSGVRPGHRVLDLAGGTGDMSALFAAAVGSRGQVVLTDPNASMMAVGRDRLWNQGHANVSLCQAPGESLPFSDDSFEVACISFGLRNFTDKDRGLLEIHRVLKPGGVLIVLEFSRPQSPLIDSAYRVFQSIWPLAGRAIVGDSASYQYLVESIRVHPDQHALKQMFEDAGFEDVSFSNLMSGVAAIHRGVKPR